MLKSIGLILFIVLSVLIGSCSASEPMGMRRYLLGSMAHKHELQYQYTRCLQHTKYVKNIWFNFVTSQCGSWHREQSTQEHNKFIAQYQLGHIILINFDNTELNEYLKGKGKTDE